MSTHYGPGINRDGLAFAFEMNALDHKGMGNKSWRGKPTTNLVPDATNMTNWTSYSSGNDGTFTTEFGTTGYRINRRNTWNGLYRGITLPSAGTYTISAWFRIRGKSSGNNGINVYTSGGGISDTAAGGDDTRIGEWQRISMTRTYTTTSITFYIISWGGTSGVDWSSWDVTMPQIEAGSFSTPFVDGSRSVTQSLLDWTGNYTITASSGMEYNSDDTFSFIGTANTSYYDINSSANWFAGMKPFTIESWTNLDTTTVNYGEIFGDYGSGYGAGLWWSTAGLYISGSVYHTNYATTMSGIHHSAVNRDGAGNVRLFRDGVLVNTGTLTSGVSGGLNYRIGADVNTGSEPMDGNIYAVNVYERVLSDDEIWKNFQSQRKRYGV